MVRPTTSRALEMADEGIISYKALAEMALKWMSEDEVATMLRANEIDLEDEEAEDDSVSYPYIINTGKTRNDLYPTESAHTAEAQVLVEEGYHKDKEEIPNEKTDL